MKAESIADWIDLVNELRNLPYETEWVEFKENKHDPEDIGEYISALSNSAALHGKPHAYLIWGVNDTSHDITGTSFAPGSTTIGNEALENWLLRLTTPKISFRFIEVSVAGHTVIILEIGQAFRHPVRFKSQEFIRVGSYKKKLKDFTEKERELWRIFDNSPFETLVAEENVTDTTVLRLLDYPAYFDLVDRPLPETRQEILNILTLDKLIQRSVVGKWNVTNLGAVLFARYLVDFPSLSRKAIRVVQYRGNNRVEIIHQQEGGKGYANGFSGLIDYVMNLVPANEVMGQAFRKTVPMYPELAVRELIANALIHQDFFVTGTGPLIEIFHDRMEISNPGRPLVETERFLDSPPRSRNEILASFMRRIGACEELGSGIDKVVFETELYQLPAPEFEMVSESTRAALFTHRHLIQMDKKDRIRACYLHACLRYVNRDFMTNSSLRARFGIDQKNSATASRLIKEATESGLIRPHDEAAARKLMKYVPYWA